MHKGEDYRSGWGRQVNIRVVGVVKVWLEVVSGCRYGWSGT